MKTPRISTLPEKEPGRRGLKGRPHRKVLTPRAISDSLAKGMNFSEISRRYGVTRNAVAKAVERLQRKQLADSIKKGSLEQAKLSLPKLAPVSTTSPIDIMGEVMSVIEDVKVFREWLGSEEAKKIGLHKRIEYFMNVWDTKLKWANGFIQVYDKLLNLVAFDTWLRDILEIAEQVAPGAKEQIRLRMRDRLYGRAIGSTSDATQPTNGTQT